MRFEEAQSDEEYVIYASLHLLGEDGTDQGVLTKDGKAIEATANVRSVDDGRVLRLPITFDARGMEGKTVACFVIRELDRRRGLPTQRRNRRRQYGRPLRDGSGKEIGMMGKRRDEMLTDSFDTAEDRMIADLLFYWMNDGSHSIPDDLYIDSFSDAIPRYRRVFREIFERAGHGAHYDMMMGFGANPLG